MISLPKKWVREMGLTQGSPLTITRHNGTSLLISADKTIGGKLVYGSDEAVVVLTVPPGESPESTVRKITSLYVRGHNLIKIKLGDNPLYSLNKTSIRELVRRLLIGVEIVSDSSDGLLLQILLGKSELTTENSMKRMSIVSTTMLEDAITSLKTLDKKRAQEVIEKDELERFSFYTTRRILGLINHDVFNENDRTEPTNLSVCLLISELIRNVAECAREIAWRAMLLDAPPTDEATMALEKLGESVSECFDASILSFFKKDSKAAELTLESVKRVPILESQMLVVAGKSVARDTSLNSFAIVSVLSSLRKIAHLSGEIASLVLYLTSDQFTRIESVIGARSTNLVMSETPSLLN